MRNSVRVIRFLSAVQDGTILYISVPKRWINLLFRLGETLYGKKSRLQLELIGDFRDIF